MTLIGHLDGWMAGEGNSPYMSDPFSPIPALPSTTGPPPFPSSEHRLNPPPPIFLLSLGTYNLTPPLPTYLYPRKILLPLIYALGYIQIHSIPPSFLNQYMLPLFEITPFRLEGLISLLRAL